ALSDNNAFSINATIAAYNEGEEWLEQLKDYLQGNIDFVLSYLKENIPQVTSFKPEATFLMWLDFTKLNLSNLEIEELLMKEACLYLNKGSDFSAENRGYMRLNIATPRVILEKALTNLKHCLNK
ncbi:MAG: cystathionine beta-lyase, partial [Bacilli bacterium]